MVIAVGNTGSQFYFSKDLKNIVLRNVEYEKITLKVYMDELTVTEEVYYPDADGKIVIRGLSELFESFMRQEGIEDVLYRDDTPYEVFTLRFYNEDELLHTEHIGVKYCAAKTPYKGSADFDAKILSRHRLFKVLPNQNLRFSAVLTKEPAFFQLVMSVTFVKGENVGYHRVPLQIEGSSACSQINYVLSLEDVSTMLYVSGLEVAADALLSVSFAYANKETGVIYDVVTFKVERRGVKNVTSFLYMNIYGVPEIINFRGRQKEEVNGEPQFGYVNDEMVLIADEQSNIHTAHSGLISLIDYRSIVDLTNSRFVYLADTLERVTVVEYNLTRTQNVSMPIAVDIRYRLADKCQVVFEEESPEEFMNLFDQSYTEVYE